MTHSLDYKQAGVDIDAGDALVDQIKDYTKKTRRLGVIGGIGGFAGLFKLNANDYKSPVLIGTTDGVGTKLRLAIDHDRVTHVGQDLVAMCVNDLICCGGEPLFFLDYFATGKLDVAAAASVIKSIADSLSSIQCALLGGETAEMPGMYHGRDFDLAGFAVGVVDEPNIIDGTLVQPGDRVIGLASSGPHSNGYSLIRKILETSNLNPSHVQLRESSLLDALMAPTKLYVNPVLTLLKHIKVHAMAHITGGGIVENLPRVLPDTCQAILNQSALHVPEVFTYLQNAGNVPQHEMWRVFNMGTGFVVVVSENDAPAAVAHFQAQNCSPAVIGTIAAKRQGDASVVFES